MTGHRPRQLYTATARRSRGLRLLPAVLLATAALLTGCTRESGEAAPAHAVRPVNPAATPEAAILLERLYDTVGKGVLVGQYNNPPRPDTFTTWVERASDRTPAIWGSDFKYGHYVVHRPRMIVEAIRRSRSGSPVMLMYHAPRPMDAMNAGWESIGSDLTTSEWDSLLTPGTGLHARWLDHIDSVAVGLVALRDAGVPVLWRPYHEMNASWFWWGQQPGDGYRSIWRRIYPHIPHLVDPLTDLAKWLRGREKPPVPTPAERPAEEARRPRPTVRHREKDGFRTLWRMMYDRYTDYHGLNNLLWVWSVSPPTALVDPLEPYWPGDGYVDIVGLDVAGEKPTPLHLETLRAVAGDRPLMLTEVGRLPDPDSMRTLQPGWVAMMAYMNMVMDRNPAERVREVYAHPWVVTLDEWTTSPTVPSSADARGSLFRE